VKTIGYVAVGAVAVVVVYVVTKPENPAHSWLDSVKGFFPGLGNATPVAPPGKTADPLTPIGDQTMDMMADTRRGVPYGTLATGDAAGRGVAAISDAFGYAENKTYTRAATATTRELDVFQGETVTPFSKILA